MKRSMLWIGEAVLLAAVVAAAVAAALPGKPRVPPGPATAAVPDLPHQEPAPQPAAVRVSATPAQVAALFGWREPAPPRSPTASRPVAAKPVPPRLRSVGYIERDDGTVTWIFSDIQNGTVITLAPGATYRGWTLVEVRDQEFHLSFQGTIHVVPRKK